MSTHHDYRQNARIEPRTRFWPIALTVGTVLAAFVSYGVLIGYGM